MKSFVIKKWVEPYRLLEFIKTYGLYRDFTFDGLNKTDMKKDFFKELDQSKNSVGLYMKNVNKFYFFENLENYNVIDEIKNEFVLSETDAEYTDDIELSLNLIDIGKAEAVIILS